jgi:hypothetical protein
VWVSSFSIFFLCFDLDFRALETQDTAPIEIHEETKHEDYGDVYKYLYKRAETMLWQLDLSVVLLTFGHLSVLELFEEVVDNLDCLLDDVVDILFGDVVGWGNDDMVSAHAISRARTRIEADFIVGS